MNILIKDKMKFVQMCTTRHALKLEILGMKRSRSPSAYVLAKRNFGLTGSRQSVLEQLEALINIEQVEQEESYGNVRPIGSR